MPAEGSSRSVLAVRRTGRPGPRSNYELFNCNNLNIRYWSWNYRGCWPFLSSLWGFDAPPSAQVESFQPPPSLAFAQWVLQLGTSFRMGQHVP